MKTTSYSEPELALLEGIGEAEQGGLRITQRELASKAGLSLGMTNALLKQFAEVGWVKLTKLSTRSMVYALTPEGMAEVARRTAGFFRRASRNTGRYRERLESFILSAKASGASTLLLAGTSDLDFLLEYLCELHGLVYVKSADPERARALGRRPNVSVLYAEGAAPDAPGGPGASVRLADLLEARL
ncbi:MAG TPA: transcriptional regulator [Spirochaetales bacterium]|nr:transcriptional regulator [Spirochaetales bacterium]HRY53138.1 transcriptional regulator [Spirochaetia bacterium]HRZ66004.1 transcriptional regulator [Spirochaetia bacterium]